MNDVEKRIIKNMDWLRDFMRKNGYSKGPCYCELCSECKNRQKLYGTKK